jgi:hypothetical protein
VYIWAFSFSILAPALDSNQRPAVSIKENNPMNDGPELLAIHPELVEMPSTHMYKYLFSPLKFWGDNALLISRSATKV